MTKSNILKRKTQLEADSDDSSDQHSAEMHSGNNGSTTEILTHLKRLPLKNGSESSRRKFLMMEVCVSEWAGLSPCQKMFFIEEELSSRSETIEKRIYTLFKFHIASVGIPFENWTKELYEEAIEILHTLIDKERVSPLVKPPRKGKGTWIAWFEKFMPYVTYTPYSWEEVRIELTRKYTTYHAALLVAWQQEEKTTTAGLKNLYAECLRLDELEMREPQTRDSSGLTCRQCGIVGHMAKNCRKKNNNSSENARTARWTQSLENFSFTPKYKRGEEMIIPDGLSRLYEAPSRKLHVPARLEQRAYSASVLTQSDYDRITRIHEELGHRKSIRIDLEMRGINVTSMELRKILESCRVCLERDNQFTKHNVYVDTEEPGQLMGIDLMEYANKYVIVMIDYYTRMAFAKEVAVKQAGKIKDFVMDVYKEFPFKKIIADNGKEFGNSVLLDWLDSKGIDIYFRPPYYHEGIGRIKRLIRTLRESLNRSKGALRRKLVRVVRAYNATVHRAIGMPPLHAMDAENREKIESSIAKYKREFGRTVRLELPVGQKVLIRKEIRTKDDKHFEEIGVVESLEGYDTYWIRLPGDKLIKRNRSQLKPIGEISGKS
ncbi:hypothetical protein NEAUS07_1378 [Nematocida ausubeli]|nr:hypothetical protein NEAUS06_0188 [Nematocida ausubeli]KAI5135860.1 hypothetical protein NEAUS07_1378 [Nematocida ausubeli]